MKEGEAQPVIKLEDLAFDSVGTLYIIDARGGRILKIPPLALAEMLREGERNK